MSKWKPVVISRLQQRSPTVRSFWLTFPDRETLDFRPGQFLTLDLPISDRRRERWRSYSIAAAPDGSNQAELCIVHLPEGKGTTYLFEEATVGTEVLTKEPAGVFTLPAEPLTEDVVMICTGTGVAPFRAMLQQQLPRAAVRFHLIFGCRTAADILYREEFAAWARQYDHFTYTVALSREKVLDLEPGVECVEGYVHQVYEAAYATRKVATRFYLCGWAVMVDEARERLLRMGVPAEKVILELYG